MAESVTFVPKTPQDIAEFTHKQHNDFGVLRGEIFIKLKVQQLAEETTLGNLTFDAERDVNGYFAKITDSYNYDVNLLEQTSQHVEVGVNRSNLYPGGQYQFVYEIFDAEARPQS